MSKQSFLRQQRTIYILFSLMLTDMLIHTFLEPPYGTLIDNLVAFMVHMFIMVMQLIVLYIAFSETIYIKNQVYSDLFVEFRPILVMYPLYFVSLVALKAVRMVGIYVLSYPEPLLWSTALYSILFYFHYIVVILYEYSLYFTIMELYKMKHYDFARKNQRVQVVVDS